MSSYVYTYSTDDLIEFANQVKDVIAEVTGHDELDDYVIMVGKPSTFRRFAEKWLGYKPSDKNTNNGFKIFVTKVANFSE